MSRQLHDDPLPFSMARIEREMREARPGSCVVCGARTWERFYGVPLCEPYDDDGTVVKRCKWIFRDGDK